MTAGSTTVTGQPLRLPWRLGVVELTQFLQHNRHTATVYAALAGRLVLAAITGAIRAMTKTARQRRACPCLP
jgi:hypothetical protein